MVLTASPPAALAPKSPHSSLGLPEGWKGGSLGPQGPPGLLAPWGLSWRLSHSLGDDLRLQKQNGTGWGSGLLTRCPTCRPAGKPGGIAAPLGPHLPRRGTHSDPGLILALRRPPGEAAVPARGAATEAQARLAWEGRQPAPPLPRGAPPAPSGARQALGGLPAPSARRPTALGPHPPLLPSPHPSPPPPPLPLRLARCLEERRRSPGRSAGGEPTAPAARSAAGRAPRLPPPDLLLPGAGPPGRPSPRPPP